MQADPMMVKKLIRPHQRSNQVCSCLAESHPVNVTCHQDTAIACCCTLTFICLVPPRSFLKRGVKRAHAREKLQPWRVRKGPALRTHPPLGCWIAAPALCRRSTGFCPRLGPAPKCWARSSARPPGRLAAFLSRCKSTETRVGMQWISINFGEHGGCLEFDFQDAASLGTRIC